MDAAAAYAATAARVLAEVLPGADWHVAVAACPGWSVHDLVGHLVGLAEDVGAGRVDGYGTAPWTAAHVLRARGVAPEALTERWRAAVEPVCAVLADPEANDTPRFVAAMTMADAVIHEHDLRATLHRRGARDEPVIGDLVANQLRRIDRACDAAGRGISLTLTGGARVELGPAGPLALTVDPFELWRATVGRRSLAQILAFDWSEPPGAIAELLLFRPAAPGPAPIDWPSADLVE